MTHTRYDAPRRRGGAGLLLTVLVVGLVVGLAAMWWAVRAHPSWFGAAAAPPPAAAPAPAVDSGTLASRNTQLAAQLATLENRTATITNDTQEAAGNAGRAEAILVTFAARRAIERGVGLGYLELQLRARLGRLAPDQTNVVIAAARRPITVEDLRAGLESAGPMLLATGGEHWWNGVAGELRNLVVIHPAGVASPRPADRLERALRLVDRGNVEAALAEVRRMPGAANAPAWTDAAARYVATQRALDTLETVAIVGAPAASAPAVSGPPSPAPTPAT